MIQSGWLFIGFCAMLVTAGTVLVEDDGWAIVLGVAGFLSWAMFAYASLDVTVVGDSVTYSFTMPVATFFGVLMSFIPGYVALTGPADIVTNWRNPDIDEM